MTAPPRIHRRSLRARVMVLGGVFVFLVVLAVGMSAWMVRSWDHSLGDRGDLRNATVDISDLRLAYSDQETGVRGYLLTDDATFLDPYRDGAALSAVLLARLHDFDRAVLDLNPQLIAIENAAQQWREDVALPVVGQSGVPDEALARDRFDALRTELDRLDAIVADELTQAIERTDNIKRATFGVLVASALAAFVAIGLIAVLFRRWVTRPLAQIGRAARALSVDNEQTLPDFESAELQDVVEAIRTLQTSLAHERDRAVTAYRGLEQSAVLALHVRSELADELGDPPPGWTVGSALVPADGLVAGDCFDLGLLDQHRMYVVLVDVTGHGANAALDALKSKSQLRAALRSRVSPGGALEWLSRENSKDERADLLTAVVAVIDVDTGVCHFANAGHPPPILTNGAATVVLERTGPLLGAFAASWRTGTVTIKPGWTLLFHTDGITEALGADRERFGEERFDEWLRSAEMSDPKALVHDLLAEIESYRVGKRTDDVTIVAVRRAADTDEVIMTDGDEGAEDDLDIRLADVDTVQP